jgi:hypothetical protein
MEKMEGCQHEWEEFISGKKEKGYYEGNFHVRRFLRCKKCGAEKFIAEGVARESEVRGVWEIYWQERNDVWEPALPDEMGWR